MTQRLQRHLLRALLASSTLLPTTTAQATPTPLQLDYLTPESYQVQKIHVTGTQTLDPQAIIALSGLQIGDPLYIPGPAIADAIQRIWQQKLVQDVAIHANKTNQHSIELTIQIKESQRLTHYTFEGIRKRESKEIDQKIDLTKGKIVNDELLQATQKTIQDHYTEKGYRNATIHISTQPDPETPHHVQLKITIHKGPKRIINQIQFQGNHHLSSHHLKAQMQHLHERPRITLIQDLLKQTITLKPILKGGLLWHPISIEDISSYLQRHITLFTSKFDQAKLKADQQNIINAYRSQGYRDAQITATQIEEEPDADGLNITITIDEGPQYHIRSLRWTGNYLHTDQELNQTLDIKPGDIYNPVQLKQRLNGNQQGQDIAALYYEDGYLFYSATPIETGLVDNAIDIEIRIHEGTQAHINEIIIEGNKITHDYVIQRELRTLPGDKFSRAKLIRSYRQLTQLNIFDPAIDIQPLPDPDKGTTDILYKIKERPKVQFDVKGSWAGTRLGIVMGVKLGINNFAINDLFKRKKWRPIPMGAAQTFNLEANASGKAYQSLSLQFTEPWIGGQRPLSLSLALNASRHQTNPNRFSDERTKDTTLSSLQSTTEADTDNKASINTLGIRTGIGKRLSWPDDYTTLRGSIAYYRHSYTNYDFLGKKNYMTGVINDLSLQASIERNSTDNPIYPTEGTIIRLSTKLTPLPLSTLTTKDYSTLPDEQKFNWAEYHQWMLDATLYITLVEQLVLSTRAHLGLLGGFSTQLGIGPFQRFHMGGGGLPGRTSLLNEETISLRGYPEEYLPKQKNSTYAGGVLYDKIVLELRYPIITSFFTQIYTLAFAEAGNTWTRYQDFQLTSQRPSAGVGIRIYLPFLIGTTIGFDLGYGFHKDPGDPQDRLELHFSMGMNLR